MTGRRANPAGPGPVAEYADVTGRRRRQVTSFFCAGSRLRGPNHDVDDPTVRSVRTACGRRRVRRLVRADDREPASPVGGGRIFRRSACRECGQSRRERRHHEHRARPLAGRRRAGLGARRKRCQLETRPKDHEHRIATPRSRRRAGRLPGRWPQRSRLYRRPGSSVHPRRLRPPWVGGSRLRRLRPISRGPDRMVHTRPRAAAAGAGVGPGVDRFLCQAMNPPAAMNTSAGGTEWTEMLWC